MVNRAGVLFAIKELCLAGAQCRERTKTGKDLFRLIYTADLPYPISAKDAESNQFADGNCPVSTYESAPVLVDQLQDVVISTDK